MTCYSVIFTIVCSFFTFSAHASSAAPKNSPTLSPPIPDAKADIVPGKTFTLSKASAHWGETLHIDATKLRTHAQAGRCRFRFSYNVINQGNAATETTAFASRLFEDDSNIVQSQILSLKAGESAKALGHIFLANGSHELQVFVDSDNQITENFETNNWNRIQVVVTGCGKH